MYLAGDHFSIKSHISILQLYLLSYWKLGPNCNADGLNTFMSQPDIEFYMWPVNMFYKRLSSRETTQDASAQAVVPKNYTKT